MAMIETDEAVIVDHGAGPPARAVVWLHGLGADGYDFVPVVPELRLPPAPAVRFVFPHAPLRPVTINGGAVMRAWFDMTDLGRMEGARLEDIEDAVGRLNAWLETLAGEGIPPSATVLAGFSQGGVVALHAGARAKTPPAGVMALSTYLPWYEILLQKAAPAARAVPLFMAHGTLDPVIPLWVAQRSRELAETLYGPVTWRTYPIAHGVCAEELADIRAWLIQVLDLDGPSRAI